LATGVTWSIQEPLAQKVDTTRVFAIELASYPPYLADEYSELISRILAKAEIHAHSLSGAENICLLEKANGKM
jgi:hypothetical protein